jgi:hypothetical protein
MSFNITNSGRSSYIIDNVSNATINLVRGNQYVFEINASGHPFWIQTSSGSYKSKNVYSSGITDNGIQDGTLIFNVDVNAPNTLYYVCEYHSSMRGVINIVPALTIRSSSKSLFTYNSRVYYKPNKMFMYTLNGSRKSY